MARRAKGTKAAKKDIESYEHAGKKRAYVAADDREFEEMVLAVARGEMEIEPLTIWFRQRIVRTEQG